MVGRGRHPGVVVLEKQVDRLDERLLGQLRQRHASGRTAEAGCVRVGPENGHAAIWLAVGLEPFEDALGVVQEHRSGVERQRPVGTELGVVPAALGFPLDRDHVVGEDPSETRTGQAPLALGGRNWRFGRGDLESDAGDCAHDVIMRITRRPATSYAPT